MNKKKTSIPREIISGFSCPSAFKPTGDWISEQGQLEAALREDKESL